MSADNKRRVSLGEMLLIQYETDPTLSNMWKVWQHCDEYGSDLPDQVRLHMHDVAAGEIVAEESGQWDVVTRKLSMAVMDILVSNGMNKAEASRVTAKYLDDHFGIELLDPETVRTRYYRKQKKQEPTRIQKLIEEQKIQDL